MSTILVTGGTGLTGQALTRALLAKGHEVTILTRHKPGRTGTNGVQYALWDIERQVIDRDAIAKADYIIHLAGAAVVEKRWTEKRKKEITGSRVKSSELLAKVLREVPNKVKAVISASAIGWYGADKQGEHNSFTEDAPPAGDFLGETCRLWEQSVEETRAPGRRVVKFRIGIVLSTEGGAFRAFIKPLRYGIAASLGSGKQIVSWIHIDDLVGLYITAMEQEAWDGVYNAVAPGPVTNRELIRAIAKERKNFYVPVRVPAFVLQLMLGGASVEVLKSATVSSKKAEAAGYEFLYPTIVPAVRELLNNGISI